MKKEQGPDINEKIALLRIFLARAEEDVSEAIDKLLSKRIHSRVLQQDLEQIVGTALSIIGDTVTRALSLWLERASSRVYFWPGYERITALRDRWVLQEPTPDELKQILNSDTLSHGIGREFVAHIHRDRKPEVSIKNIIDSQDYNTEWFNVVLRNSAGINALPHRKIAPTGYPPSTHLWFADPKPQVRVTSRSTFFGPHNRYREYMPRFLVLSKSDNGDATFDVEAYKETNFLSVDIPFSPDESAARQFREILRKDVHGKANRRKLPIWPATREKQTTVNGKERTLIQEAQLLFYDIWLTACFEPKELQSAHWLKNRLNNFRRWAELDKTDEELEFRADYICAYLEKARLAISEAYTPPELAYSNWCSFPVHSPIWHRVNTGRAEEGLKPTYLGTAMILSSDKIDAVCYEIISEWIRSMYQGIRALERAAVQSETEIVELSQSFGHEIAKVKDGLFKFPLLTLGEIAAWNHAPIQISKTANSIEVQAVKELKVITAGSAHQAFLDQLSAWGAAPFAEWGINETPLKLTTIVDQLGTTARRIAAARNWVQEATEVKNISRLMNSELKFEEKLSEIPSLRFEETESVRDALFLLSERNAQSTHNRDRFGFLARLFVSLLANSFWHAEPRSSVTVTANAKNPSMGRALQVLILNQVRSGYRGTDEPKGIYRTKTDGVAKSCLEALGGMLEVFPTSQLNESTGTAVTSFLLPLRHPRENEPDPLQFTNSNGDTSHSWIEINTP